MLKRFREASWRVAARSRIESLVYGLWNFCEVKNRRPRPLETPREFPAGAALGLLRRFLGAPCAEGLVVT